jgi:DNA gyrase subunit A
MVVADPEATLLTACENGYGKRTPFGPNASAEDASAEDGTNDDDAETDDATAEDTMTTPEDTDDAEEDTASSSARYRTQKRGGKGVRDIKATKRNGKVIGITRVDDTDEILMMTAGGKLQRIRASEISVIGRNTQGVRIMTLGDGDTLAAVVRVPKEDEPEEEVADIHTGPTGAAGGSMAAPKTDDTVNDDTVNDDTVNDDAAMDVGGAFDGAAGTDEQGDEAGEDDAAIE